MKVIKTASGKSTIKVSKKEWQNIGKKAGWTKKAYNDDIYNDWGDDGYPSEAELGRIDFYGELSDGEFESLPTLESYAQFRGSIDDFDEMQAQAAVFNEKLAAIEAKWANSTDSAGFRDDFDKFLDDNLSFLNEYSRFVERLNSVKKEHESQMASMEHILKKYNYNIDEISKALGQAEEKAEEAMGREDWQAEAMPTPQGFQDAQDLQNERVSDASADIAPLEAALDFLQNLQTMRQPATASIASAEKRLSASIDRDIKQRKQAKKELVEALSKEASVKKK